MKVVKSGKGGKGVTWSLPQAILDMLVGEPDEVEPDARGRRDAGRGAALEGDARPGRQPVRRRPDEWERNKKPAEPTSAEFDAEFDSFLANLDGKKDEGGDDDAKA